MIPNYGMFTDRGNAMIDGVVMAARKAGMDFGAVSNLLWEISEIEGYEEASDTEVRERVFASL